MEYHLSNDTTLASFEPVSKNDMLVYLNVELPFTCLNEYLAIDCDRYVNE